MVEADTIRSYGPAKSIRSASPATKSSCSKGSPSTWRFISGERSFKVKRACGETLDQQTGQFAGTAPDFQNATAFVGRAVGYHLVQAAGYPVLDKSLLLVGRGGAFEPAPDNRLVESVFEHDRAEWQVVVSRFDSCDRGVFLPGLQLVLGREYTVFGPDDGPVPVESGGRMPGYTATDSHQFAAQTIDAAVGEHLEEAAQGVAVVAHAAVKLVQAAASRWSRVAWNISGDMPRSGSMPQGVPLMAVRMPDGQVRIGQDHRGGPYPERPGIELDIFVSGKQARVEVERRIVVADAAVAPDVLEFGKRAGIHAQRQRRESGLRCLGVK